MELLKKEEVNVIENTYTLQDETSVFYYKELIDSKGRVVDAFLRDKDGFEIDDAGLLEEVEEFIDSLEQLDIQKWVRTFKYNKKQTAMAKKKLREWEIPMNLSNQERVLYKMTVVDQINNSAKIATENFQ